MVEGTALATRVARGNKAIIVEEILTKEQFPDFSLARITIDGINDKVLQENSGALYIMVSGEKIEFTIREENKQERVVILEPGKRVFIPKGSWYQDTGKGVMYSICSPAFDAAKIKVAGVR